MTKSIIFSASHTLTNLSSNLKDIKHSVSIDYPHLWFNCWPLDGLDSDKDRQAECCCLFVSAPPGSEKYNFWVRWSIRNQKEGACLYLHSQRSSRFSIEKYRTCAIRPRSIYSIFHFFACDLFKKAVYSRRRST